MNEGGFKDLIVWQKGMALVLKVYELTRNFPMEEKYGLVAHLRRAAVSIPSNIAEGHERHTTQEFILGLSHAQGSAAEVETQLLIAQQLGFCSESDTRVSFGLIREVRKMLGALRFKLQRC